jgi:mRNA-degrading endonuclease YafQ of YafQ-DinJ toxin-antitoxin module
MKYAFKSSFDRSVKQLNDDVKIGIKKLVFDIIDLVATGKIPSKGQGLTRLHKDYWEARATIRERILFKLTDDSIQFILVGSHEDVKRFLKHI